MNSHENYSSHRQQYTNALPDPARATEIEEAALAAFQGHIQTRKVAFINFSGLSVEELGSAFLNYPILIKSTLACVNVASRAVERDLGISIDTYKNSITREKAFAIAGYIKPLLPDSITVPALIELDRYFWVDKTMRANKASWEKRVENQINQNSIHEFKKRKFVCAGQSFELDSAYPKDGENIEVGVDVKRIEAPRDIHKRIDEIINKASKFKSVYPIGLFFVVIYYPFTSQQTNVRSRLSSSDIDGVYFADESDSAINECAKLLIGHAGLLLDE